MGIICVLFIASCKKNTFYSNLIRIYEYVEIANLIHASIEDVIIRSWIYSQFSISMRDNHT